MSNIEGIKKIQHDFRLGYGEAEALLLAKKLNYPIAVDDGPTIKACKILGQRFTTAIHFILNLVSQNRMDLKIALEKMEKLSRYGRYNKRIIEDATNRLKGGN